MKLRRSDFDMHDYTSRAWQYASRSYQQSDGSFAWLVKRAYDTRGVYAILIRTPFLTMLTGIALLCDEASRHHGRLARLAVGRLRRLVRRLYPDLDDLMLRIPALMGSQP